MNSFRLCLIAIGAVMLFSCRKTKLKEEKEILAGEWKWIYTEEYADPSLFTIGTLESVIEADSFPVAYKLQFQTNGTMYRWQDNESEKDRIVMKTFERISPAWYVIRLQGDNKNKKELNMDLLDRAVDTLIVDEYPFNDVHDANGHTYHHQNFFVRQQ